MFKQVLLTTTLTATAIGLVNWSHALAAKADPHSSAYADNSPISLTGVVTKTSPESFELSYGEGIITIEMDDWDWYDEVNALQTGEKVTVHGDIDQDLYESRKIEADSVFVHDRSTYYFANDVDEEDYYSTYYYYPSRTTADVENVEDGTWVSARGTVMEVNGQEFTLNLGHDTIKVDTEDMAYNPLDKEGYQQIQIGDRVYVSGEMDKDFFEAKEIDAHQVLTLYKDKGLANPS